MSLAHRHPDLVDGIILENTFLSISAMVDRLLPYIAFAKRLVLRIDWNSDEKIQKLKQAILFISGSNDELVPPFHMKKLYELATSSKYKDFFLVLSGTHNDTWDVAGIEYYEVSNLIC